MSTIVVVGSVNLDVTMTVERMPVAGETVAATGYAESSGGKGANQAVAAARAGGRVALIARIGADDEGHRLRNAIASEGVDVTHVEEVPGVPTGRAFVEVDAHGDNRIVIVAGANAAWSGAPRWPWSQGDMLLVQREIPDAVTLHVVREAAVAGVSTVWNPSPFDAQAVRRGCPHVATLVVNEHEAAAILDVAATDVVRGPVEAARRLRAWGPATVVVTLGARGAAFATVDDEGVVEGIAVDAVDTTGAGDAFTGCLAVRRLEGASWRDSVRFANAAGALSTMRSGAQSSFAARHRIDEVSRV